MGLGVPEGQVPDNLGWGPRLELVIPACLELGGIHIALSQGPRPGEGSLSYSEHSEHQNRHGMHLSNQDLLPVLWTHPFTCPGLFPGLEEKPGRVSEVPPSSDLKCPFCLCHPLVKGEPG